MLVGLNRIALTASLSVVLKGTRAETPARRLIQ